MRPERRSSCPGLTGASIFRHAPLHKMDHQTVQRRRTVSKPGIENIFSDPENLRDRFIFDRNFRGVSLLLNECPSNPRSGISLDNHVQHPRRPSLDLDMETLEFGQETLGISSCFECSFQQKKGGPSGPPFSIPSEAITLLQFRSRPCRRLPLHRDDASAALPHAA